jgi:hypothetical protein
MGAWYSLRFCFVDCLILLLCVAVLNRHQIHIAQITGFTPGFRLGFMLPFLIFNVQDLWVVFVHVFFPFTIVLSFGIDLCLVITSCFILNSLTAINTWIWKKFMNSGPHQRQVFLFDVFHEKKFVSLLSGYKALQCYVCQFHHMFESAFCVSDLDKQWINN